MTPTKQHNVNSFLTDTNTNRFFIEYADGTTVEYQNTDDAKALSEHLYISLYNKKNIEKFKSEMKVFEIYED